jgi:hypothetical protein
MIHEIAHQLESDGFGIIKPIEDPDGTIAYWLRREGEDFVLVTKEYAYRGLASFMERIVNQAANNRITLLFYENKNESITAFDAEFYKSSGALSHGKSKKRESRWLELPINEGAELEDYLRGAASPSTRAGNNATLGVYQ